MLVLWESVAPSSGTAEALENCAVVDGHVGMVVGRALCIWQVGRVQVALKVTTVVALSTLAY